MKKYIFWGASSLGEEAYKKFGGRVEFFIDNDKEKQFKNIDGKDILSPNI